MEFGLPYSKSLGKAAAGVILVSLFSKMLGFGREIVIAAQLGATSAGDIFRVATFLPTMLFGILAYGFTNTFIPLLTEQETKAGHGAVKRYVTNVTNAITVLMVLLTALGMLLNPWIVKVIAPGFNRETYQLTVAATYWLMPNIVLLGFIGLATGYLNYRQIFVLPRISGLVFNLLIITTLVILVPRIGLFGAVAGLIVAYTGQAFSCLLLLGGMDTILVPFSTGGTPI